MPSKSITIGAAEAALERLSAGDLSTVIQHEFADGLDELRIDFNTSVRRLAETIAAVSSNARSIDGKVAHVDAAARDYLRRISPKHRYWVVDEVDALPARMLARARLLAGRG